MYYTVLVTNSQPRRTFRHESAQPSDRVSASSCTSEWPGFLFHINSSRSTSRDVWCQVPPLWQRLSHSGTSNRTDRSAITLGPTSSLGHTTATTNLTPTCFRHPSRWPASSWPIDTYFTDAYSCWHGYSIICCTFFWVLKFSSSEV